MKKERIKFSSSNNPLFFSELKDKVSTYFQEQKKSRSGSSKIIFKSFIMFALYLGPFILMLTAVITSVWLMAISWFIMGLGMAGIGMCVMHDANHKSYSKSKFVNKWVGKSMYILGGFPYNWIQQHNNQHHTYTNIDGYDEDIDPGSIMRFSPHKPLLKFHKYQHIYGWFLYGLMTISWITDKDFSQLKGYKDRGIKFANNTYTQLFTKLIISKLLYYLIFFVLPFFILEVSWYWIPIFFLIMHFTGGFLMTIIFQTAHVVPDAEYPLPDSEGKMENNWAVHQLHTTTDFSPKNKILSWFIGGLNYQIEHHLFPNISHIHYPKLALIVKETAQKYNLPYHVHPKFLGAVIEHGKMLKKLGRE
jgi:linoleoyl-CoA desaturase